jgi:MFS family permease
MAALDPGSAEAARPNRLGSAYAELWTAASVSYLGDGIYDTALPLLAARLTRDPLVVASVGVAGQLPWLLFALPGGALVDRRDRRRVLWVVDAYRAVIAGSLAASIVAGWASIPLLGAAGFLLAAGGTLFNPASMSVLPALLRREPTQLERANGRLAAAQTVGEHFLGPSAGGLLFSVSRAVPFLVDAVSFAVSSALIASIPGRFAPGAGRAGGTTRRGGGLRAEIAEGLR